MDMEDNILKTNLKAMANEGYIEYIPPDRRSIIRVINQEFLINRDELEEKARQDIKSFNCVKQFIALERKDEKEDFIREFFGWGKNETGIKIQLFALALLTLPSHAFPILSKKFSLNFN